MKNRSLFNVLLLSACFFLIYTATGTENQIQRIVVYSIMNENPDIEWDGYMALCIVYVMFSFGNFLVPSILTLISTERCLFISSLLHLICSFVFFYPLKYMLNIASAFQGFAAAVMWTCQGKYLIENSDSKTIDRNTGLFWAIYEGGLVLGGVYCYFQFQGVEVIHEYDRFRIYFFLSIVFLIGSIMFLFLQRSTIEITDISLEKQTNILTALKQCLKLFKTKEMIMISIATFYTGLEQSFFNSVYPTVIGFTKASSFGTESVKLIGLYGILNGLGEMCGGLVFGWFGKRFVNNSRSRVYFLGILIHVVTFLLIFLNHSNSSTYEETEDNGLIEPRSWISMINGFCLGIGDACLSTQIIALIGSFYTDPIDISSAYALYKFIHSIGAAICFFYATSLFNMTLYVHISILIVFSIISVYSYHLSEKLIMNRKDLTIIYS